MEYKKIKKYYRNRKILRKNICGFSLEYRRFQQKNRTIYAAVQIQNGFANDYHIKGVKQIYLGDARINMGNSLMIALGKWNTFTFYCISPKNFPKIRISKTM